MRIAIVQFPGSNCERETMLAVQRAGMQAEEFLWNAAPAALAACAGFVIVGGFSYEDRGRAGVIAAQDPILQIIKAESQLGKPVLGICNGAQILVEAGLVPGVENDKLSMVLTDNKRIQQGKVLGTGFYNAWVHLRLAEHYQLNAFTRKLQPKDILHVPIAHAEGRFVIPPALLIEIRAQGLNVFQYCDASGNIIDEFPVNPNGSVANIAAISNKAGNVLAMMPHPERTPKGDAIFQSMRDYIEAGYVQRVTPLHYYPRELPLTRYQAAPQHYTLCVELMIADNHALSIENAIRHMGLNAKIKRQIHWEIACESAAIYEKIKQSEVLFNPRKEKIVTSKPTVTSLLVRSKEDMVGLQKQQMLTDHFAIAGISAVRQSVVWEITASEAAVEKIIASHILYNPYAHECYYYA